MKNKILIFVLTLSLSLGIFIGFSKTTKAYTPTQPINTMEIYGPNSFHLIYDYPNGVSTIELNSYMKTAFNSGASATWEFDIFISLYQDIAIEDFYLLFNNVDGIKELNFESDSGNTATFVDNFSYIYTEENLDIDSVKRIYFIASGTSLLDIVFYITNNGYNQGFSDGYNKGYSKGETNGFNEGYSKGEDYGYNLGFDKGYYKGINEEGNSLYDMILAVVDTPFRVFDNIFDFDVLGINIKNIVLSFSTVAIAIFVIKRFI